MFSTCNEALWEKGEEKLLKSMDVPSQKRILEINPTHPVFETMNGCSRQGRMSK